MKKVKYYQISYSVDKKVTGTKESQIINFIDPENNSTERTKLYSYLGLDHINDTLDFTKFKIENDAKLTDIMSSNFFSSYLFISSHFREILNDFVLSNIKLIEVLLTKKDEHFKYYIVSNIETTDIIDFKESTFIGDKSSPALRIGGEIIKTDTYEDYCKKNSEIWNEKGFGFILVPQKIILNYYSDLVKFPFDNVLYISEMLKKKIEDASLTGIVLEESDIDFFISK